MNSLSFVVALVLSSMFGVAVENLLKLVDRADCVCNEAEENILFVKRLRAIVYSFALY
jgi:hypothetical protein